MFKMFFGRRSNRGNNTKVTRGVGEYEWANTWAAESFNLLMCKNDKDNVPQETIINTGPYEQIYYISQNRSPGYKDQGQDAMARARHGNWEVHVLCDGHDKNGHSVAKGVCMILPHVILRLIHERADPFSPIEKDLLIEAYDETADVVCWTSHGVDVGMFVKIFGGSWDGKVGYIRDTIQNGRAIVMIVDETGYHRPLIETKYIRGARYVGGCTCVSLVRNVKTNECRIAVAGDSRIMIMYTDAVNDPVLKPEFGEPDPNRKMPPLAFATPQHNVFNMDERARLEENHAGAYEFDGSFLVNPVTRFAIQPTRGFGDFDMFGTGYTNVPEVSNSFKLSTDALVFGASDGIFDSHVWNDEELISFIARHAEADKDPKTIANLIYYESLNRSLDGGYVDDISMFLFFAVPEAEFEKRETIVHNPKEPELDPESLEELQKEASKTSYPELEEEDPKRKRKTIQKGTENTLTALSGILSSVMKDASGEAADPDSVAGKDEIVGEVLQKFAKTFGGSLDDVDPEKLAQGRIKSVRFNERRAPKMKDEEDDDEEEEEEEEQEQDENAEN